MKTNTGFLLFVFGLIMTAFGVGGVEHSLTNTELVTAVLVSGLGLALMYVGTLGVRNGEYHD